MTPRFTAVSRGKAYWVKSKTYADYYGPLRKLNAVTVRLENVTDPTRGQSVTARLELEPSLPAPGSMNAAEILPLRVRGDRDSQLHFTYTPLGGVGQFVEVVLAPGESQDVRVDLPVSGEGSSQRGLWVGEAVLTSVDRVEIQSGEEYDAAFGTPDGTEPKETVLTEVTKVTDNGVTISTVWEEVFFNADGVAQLDRAGVDGNQVALSSEDETVVYEQGVDYSLERASYLRIEHPGSGYSATPKVSFEGGAPDVEAEATAVLSASVKRVKILAGGSGYTAPVSVTFVGGGGEGAEGIAVVSPSGLITDVFITNGGQHYEAPPAVEFSGGGGSGADAETSIAGGVGRVMVTTPGSGYSVEPKVVFVSANGEGEGAKASVELDADAGGD